MEETLRTCSQYLTTTRREDSKEHRDKKFHRLVLQRKLQTVVWWITKQETGRLLQHVDMCTKTV